MPDYKVLTRILDSNDFGVGGGSAAALSGAMAGALLAMVCRLSMKKDYGLTLEKYQQLAEEAEQLSKKLLEGADEDAQAFASVKEAFSLPKQTVEEKMLRKKAIESGMIGAAMVPKTNGWYCRRIQEMITDLHGKSNPSASSDLAVGRFLADTGLMGCILNIEVNVPSIESPDAKSSIQKEAEELRQYVQLNIP